MKYVAACMFRDIRSGHVYDKGEPFPYKGEVSEERITELSTNANKAGYPLIVAVEEPKPKKAPAKRKTTK